MAVAAQRFERKGKGVTYLQGWGQRVVGTLSVVGIAAAAIHFLHRIGIAGVRRWDVIGWILGFEG
jgi:hypothetical protein